MTQEWANQLLALGYSPAFPLSYNRVTGAVDDTLGQLAAQAAGTYRETFHFVLNNHVVKNNRIPPYGMAYEEARKRNALPVPAAQYGSPGPAGTYNYWDAIALNPPARVRSATLRGIEAALVSVEVGGASGTPGRGSRRRRVSMLPSVMGPTRPATRARR